MISSINDNSNEVCKTRGLGQAAARTNVETDNTWLAAFVKTGRWNPPHCCWFQSIFISTASDRQHCSDGPPIFLGQPVSRPPSIFVLNATEPLYSLLFLPLLLPVLPSLRLRADPPNPLAISVTPTISFRKLRPPHHPIQPAMPPRQIPAPNPNDMLRYQRPSWRESRAKSSSSTAGHPETHSTVPPQGIVNTKPVTS
jgi:hypothetical protein